MKNKTNKIEDIIFEERDVQIFSIPDIKTRLSTLQNYFFPRLEVLLRHSLDLVQEIYNVNPYQRMAFVYCPSHRKNAKENMDWGMVHIGISAKRGKKPLKIIKRNGQPLAFLAEGGREIMLQSHRCYFPVDERGLNELIFAFVFLYSLEEAWRGYIVTTSYFTNDAEESAAKNEKIFLADMNTLVEWHLRGFQLTDKRHK